MVWPSLAPSGICTSTALPPGSVMRVLPKLELDVISLTPAIAPSERSSGVATVAAIDSGLAPGRLALTWMAG